MAVSVAIASLVLAAHEAIGMSLLESARSGTLEAGEWDTWLDRDDALYWAYSGLLVAYVVTLAAWVSRYIDDMPTLGGGIARWGPRVGIVASVIPLLDVIVLPLILRDASRRMAPDGKGHLRIISAWWLVGLASAILTVVWTGWLLFGLESPLIIEPGTSPEQMVPTAVGGIIWAAAPLLLVVIVRRMQRDQDHWVATTGPVVSGPPPAPAEAEPDAAARQMVDRPPPSTVSDVLRSRGMVVGAGLLIIAFGLELAWRQGLLQGAAGDLATVYVSWTLPPTSLVVFIVAGALAPPKPVLVGMVLGFLDAILISLLIAGDDVDALAAELGTDDLAGDLVAFWVLAVVIGAIVTGLVGRITRWFLDRRTPSSA